MDAARLWRPTDPEFIADPYPIYREIRHSEPVFRAITGDFVVMGYDEVRQVLMDRSCKTGVRSDWVRRMSGYAQHRGQDFNDVQTAVSGMLIQVNPPDHTHIRTLLSKRWPTRDQLEHMAGEMASDLCTDLPPTFDMVKRISRALPLRMICEILAIDPGEGKKLERDGFRLVQLLDPYLSYKELQKIRMAASNLYSYFQAHLPEIDPKAPSLAAGIKRMNEVNNGDFDPVSLMVFLFIAGFETTSTLVNTCIWCLLKAGSQQVQLKNTREVESFVAEVLRMYSPVQLTGRTNTEPLSLGGISIPANSTLTLCIGSANRDEKRFDDPDRLDLQRSGPPHLSFGYGMHHCLGNQMAVIEAAAVIEKLLPVIHRLELTGEPVWEPKLTIRSVRSMPVKYHG